MPRQVYTIDGANFSTLEEFYDEIGTSLIPGTDWGRNLDAFNEILAGGLSTPDESFDLHWQNSDLSRQRLGYPETIRQLETRLMTCDPSNVPVITLQLKLAKASRGPTVFNWLVDIIASHSGVNLILD